MSSYPAEQICSPPDLPPYLTSVCDLKPIVGVPSDEEMVGIHAVIRMARKAVDIPGMHDPALLAKLEEHLFDTQMARYRSKYPCSIFHLNATYTPPVLPAHVSTQLEPVSGVPSEEEVVKVQDAIRSYQKFVEIPPMFDPRVHAELNQHLFDVQMARYIQRCAQANPVPRETSAAGSVGATHSTGQVSEGTNTATNNVGSGAEVPESHQLAQPVSTDRIHDAIERSNQLAEQANQLVERSNQIAEQLVKVVEKSNQPAEQPNRLFETFTELFGRLNGHFKQSNRLAEASMKPVEKLADILGNINKVLVKIQHAIIRSHKGNTLNAVDSLANEKGCTFLDVGITLSSLSNLHADESDPCLPVVVDGTSRNFHIPGFLLRKLLDFYGIGDGLSENIRSTLSKGNYEMIAGERLCAYLSSCLG